MRRAHAHLLVASSTALLAALLGAGVGACHGTTAVTPTPPRPAPRIASPVTALARACTKVATCAHDHDPATEREPAACVEQWLEHPHVHDVVACLDRAATCEQIDACVHERVDAAASAYCQSHPDEQTGCDGDKLILCGDDDPDESTTSDCAAMGAKCGEHRVSGLLTKACLSPMLCPPDAAESRCEGGAVIACHEGAVEREACPQGTACTVAQEHGHVRAVCRGGPNYVECSAVTDRRCEGNKLVTCASHGLEGQVQVIDCTSLGLVCDGNLPRPACALPGARDCTPGPARCEDDALTFCAAGAKVAVGCTTLGFEGCSPEAHGLYAGCKLVGSGPKRRPTEAREAQPEERP
jgi:hypothetical protein